MNAEESYYDRYWSEGVGGWRPGAGLSEPLRGALRGICTAKAVLDYGGGDGQRYGHIVRDVASRYVVADVSPIALEARRSYGDEVVAIDELAGCNDRFDTLVMLEVLEHVLDPLGVLTMAASLLNPGGRAIISVPNGFSLWNRLRMVAGRLPASGVGPPGVRGHTYDAPHIRFFDLSSLEHLLERGGLAVEAVWTDTPEIGPLGRFVRPKRRTLSPRSVLLAGTLIAECRVAGGVPYPMTRRHDATIP